MIKIFIFPLLVIEIIAETILTGGTLTLSSHFPIQMTEMNGTDCQVFNTDQGIMFLEALIYAVEQINSDPYIMHGHTFSLQAYDTCFNTKQNPYYSLLDNAVAVIGPYSSELTEFTTKFLEIFRITTVSYGASSTSLSNRELYSHCFRTVPTDSYTSFIYFEMARKFDWSYVGVIYTDNEDGTSILTDFGSLMLTEKRCVAYRFSVKDSDEIERYKHVIQKTLDEKKIKVMFLFLSVKACHSFFHAAHHFEKEFKRIQFVMGTQCGTMAVIPPSLHSAFEGMIVVQTAIKNISNFEKYFSSLRPSTNTRNRWFQSYWASVYNCTFDKTDKNTRLCHDTNHTKFNRLAPVHQVIDGVYMIAHGIRKAYDHLCKDVAEKRACYANRRNARLIFRSLHDHLYSVTKPEKFSEYGSINRDYDIFQFQNTTSDFEYVRIGYWNYSKWIHRRQRDVIEYIQMVNLTHSVCSKPCGARQVRQKSDFVGCCWQCLDCEHKQVIINNSCIDCKLGFKANQDMTKCLPLPTHSMDPKATISLVVLSGSIVCLLASIVVLVIYCRNYNTPLIKATSRELALFSLIGLILMLLTPIIYIQKPSNIICCVQKLIFGLSLTCCYAPLVLKTNRIYRIFVSSQKFQLRRLLLVSMTSQFLLVAGMVGIQLVMSIFWILTDQPFVQTQYPEDEYYVIKVCTASGTSTSLNILFPAALMLASTFWAFKTRNLPETFSEIKSIGVTMYVTLFIATCALATTIIIQDKWVFGDTYVVCFTFQLIVAVNLIGQYGKKVKMIYLEEVFEINPSENHTEISVVQNSCGSPLPNVRTFKQREKTLKLSSVYVNKNRLHSTKSSSPESTISNQFNLDL